ncbi:MAG: hypothetical protein KF878_34215, partial [Planctomycetes bacterium]|nr:hypothetical protein [Planctomycetota bacterium]
VRQPPPPEPVRQPPPPEPRRAPVPMPREIGSESVAQRDARLQETMRELSDFNEFATTARDEVKGKIPAILFTNEDEAEWMALIAYFDLLPIAYAKSDPSYYITIDVARRSMNHTRDFEFLQQRYGRNGMLVRQLGTMPQFVAAARAIMAQFSIAPHDLTIQFLLPRPFAAYLNWKALKTCHEQRLDPATVKACRGRLVREGSKWVWRVDDLVLEDGRTTRVGRGG